MEKTVEHVHYILDGKLGAINALDDLSPLENGRVAWLLQTELADRGALSRIHLAGGGRDLARDVDTLIQAPETQIVFFMPVAGDPREAEKLAELRSKIRRDRKDLYLVLASQTSGASAEDQYATALDMMKSNHANLVLAHDKQTGLNMVVVPEEAYYAKTADVKEAVGWLAKIATARAGLTFTHSTVLADAPLVPWQSPEISTNLRDVVNFAVDQGAFKTFRGRTAGHFALRGAHEGEFLTSGRGRNFNRLSETGLVRVFAKGSEEVVAHGVKPSVGGQSQRIIFGLNPQLSNIVHFHCPMLSRPANSIPVREQWPYECGSHECGKNTADGLREVSPGIHAVMLENHGPNIVFGNEIPAPAVIDFIRRNFDLQSKTGYLFGEPYRGASLAAPSPEKLVL
ncbi:MAG: class II aldolase/adducin family protein [Alphaproteobacteria bacterium]|nr:class II aldolase/adducin family protein [Alphaproteobacteria bacterium]